MKIRQEVYDDYWRLAAERQNIFFRRLHGEPPPYTTDPILAHYKFCQSSNRIAQVKRSEIFWRVRVFKINDYFNSHLFWEGSGAPG